MKGDELKYQIEAIQLNKIDEVSVEHSSEFGESSLSHSMNSNLIDGPGRDNVNDI